MKKTWWSLLVGAMRYRACGRNFDDLSETILAGSHQPLAHWITTLYLFNLNISVACIATELDLSEEEVRR